MRYLNITEYKRKRAPVNGTRFCFGCFFNKKEELHSPLSNHSNSKTATPAAAVSAVFSPAATPAPVSFPGSPPFCSVSVPENTAVPTACGLFPAMLPSAAAGTADRQFAGLELPPECRTARRRPRRCPVSEKGVSALRTVPPRILPQSPRSGHSTLKP